MRGKGTTFRKGAAPSSVPRKLIMASTAGDPRIAVEMEVKALAARSKSWGSGRTSMLSSSIIRTALAANMDPVKLAEESLGDANVVRAVRTQLAELRKKTVAGREIRV